jgi:hypothetical protein
MVFNATFNNISVMSWRSVLLVKETRVQVKTTDLPQVTDELYHIMCYHRLENLNNFWLVKTPVIKNPYSPVLLGHITGCI